MVREKYRDKPFPYKLISALLRVAGGIVIVIVVLFAARFFSETPLYRMFDGISVSEIIRMGLIIISVPCLVVSFWKALGGGIATLIPVTIYTILESIENSMFTAGVINYILFGIALMYIIMGIVKIRLEHDRMEDIMGPRIEKNDGPNLMDLHL